MGDEAAVEVAREIRGAVQVLGGKFMTSPELAEVEAEVGLPPRTLYLRGRSAVLGDPPPKVVAELFGIFPSWLFEFALPPAMAALDAASAVRAYARSSAKWAHVSLSGADDPGRLADLLFRLVDAADASGLALFAGWQLADRPEDDVERLAFALMVFREFRGGVHFAALRAVGLTVSEAVVADPEGGPGRLLRTAWSEEAAGELIATAEAKGDLRERWRYAEHLTDQRVAELLAVTLTDDEQGELQWRLAALRDVSALIS
ncbi:SCO6745 family protein [Amycolatopsis speibonae]|uniref:XRE family transcriptional regulator n=1 Tax=Amycolatopsis speibonae TaxID=1450224 RepID=A0ABV7NS80_9PSEU